MWWTRHPFPGCTVARERESLREKKSNKSKIFKNPFCQVLVANIMYVCACVDDTHGTLSSHIQLRSDARRARLTKKNETTSLTTGPTRGGTPRDEKCTCHFESSVSHSDKYDSPQFCTMIDGSIKVKFERSFFAWQGRGNAIKRIQKAKVRKNPSIGNSRVWPEGEKRPIEYRRMKEAVSSESGSNESKLQNKNRSKKEKKRPRHYQNSLKTKRSPARAQKEKRKKKKKELTAFNTLVIVHTILSSPDIAIELH